MPEPTPHEIIRDVAYNQLRGYLRDWFRQHGMNLFDYVRILDHLRDSALDQLEITYGEKGTGRTPGNTPTVGGG